MRDSLLLTTALSISLFTSGCASLLPGRQPPNTTVIVVPTPAVVSTRNIAPPTIDAPQESASSVPSEAQRSHPRMAKCRTLDHNWRAWGTATAILGSVATVGGIGLAINSQNGNNIELGGSLGAVTFLSGVIAGVGGMLSQKYAKAYVAICTVNTGGSPDFTPSVRIERINPPQPPTVLEPTPQLPMTTVVTPWCEEGAISSSQLI